MIYSVNFLDMAVRLNPIAVCQYLEQTEWRRVPFKRDDVKIYQYDKEDDFRQVNVPMSRELIDYRRAMYDVVENIAGAEGKSVEQVMLYLLNPNTDILKIRMDKKEVESGNILFDDAISLYENVKKLLAATALDIINPKKIHYGRADETVQEFLSRCRFGQTEIGSYVVSVVCPFAELSDTGMYKQLSIFSDEEKCANSLTRRVTNRLMDNVAYIKKQIDENRIDSLAREDNGISSNFFEALNGLNLQSDNTLVEFTAEWSPTVKANRSMNNNIKVTNDYYQPIMTVIDSIKDTENRRTEVIGKIKQLTAAPAVDKRESGKIVVVFIGDNNKAKCVTANLQKEDYENAVEAHQHGKTVRIIGDMVGKGKLRMDNAIFSVIE
jgi:hypothetical protein